MDNRKSGPKLSLAAQFDDLSRAQADLVAHGRIEDELIGFLVSFQQCQGPTVPELLVAIDEKSNRILTLEKDIRSYKIKLKDVRSSLDKALKEKALQKKKTNDLNWKLKEVQKFLFDVPPVAAKEKILSCLDRNNFQSEEETTDNSLSDLEYDRSDEDLVDVTQSDTQSVTSSELNATLVELKEQMSTIEENSFLNITTSQIDVVGDNGWAGGVPKSVTLRTPGNHTYTRTESAFIEKQDTTFKLPMRTMRSVPTIQRKKSNSMVPFQDKIVTSSTPDMDSSMKDPLDHLKHKLVSKKIFSRPKCSVCGENVAFMSDNLRCATCNSICHPDCVAQLSARPCVPLVKRSNQSLRHTVIADYAPKTAPRVPAIMVYCIQEIERRGLFEEGLYRKSGALKEEKELLERFLSASKGCPPLEKVSVHVLCAVVKKFLNRLDEPILTRMLWRDFAGFLKARDAVDSDSTGDDGPLLHIINQLPDPNRHSLAYLMKHLLRVASAPDAKMPIPNLAKVFAPTVVGYSSYPLPPTTDQQREHSVQVEVMMALLALNDSIWSTILASGLTESATIDRRNSSRRSVRSSLGGPLAHNGSMTPSTRHRTFKKDDSPGKDSITSLTSTVSGVVANTQKKRLKPIF